MLKRTLMLIFLLHLAVGRPAFGMSPSEEKRLFELLGEIKGQLYQIEKRFDQVDKRFEQVDKRFEQMNERFDQVDIRFTELRDDMNVRFKELREDTNNRFKDSDKKTDTLVSFLWMLTGVFSSITATVIILLVWDRRTAIKHALREHDNELEQKYGLSLLKKLVAALKEKAKSDGELAAILKNVGIL